MGGAGHKDRQCAVRLSHSKTKSLLRLVAEGVQEAVLDQNSQTTGDLPSTSEVE